MSVYVIAMAIQATDDVRREELRTEPEETNQTVTLHGRIYSGNFKSLPAGTYAR